jgi:WD40 repeat protein
MDLLWHKPMECDCCFLTHHTLQVRFHFMSEPSVGRVLDDARAMGIPKLAEFVDRDIQQARKQGRALRGGYGPSADQWQSLHTHGDPLKGHAGSVEALVWYSPTDGGDACLISGSRDGQVRLWSAGSRVGEILQTGQADSIGAVHSLALHGDVLISGGQKKANGAAMHVWCLVSKRRVRHVDDGHVDAVMCMSTGRGRLYSGSWDMTVREWSMPDVSCSRVIRVGSPILSLLVCGSSLAFNIKTGVAMSCNLEDDTSEPSTCGCDESKGITTMVVTSGPRQHKIGGMSSTSTCFVAGGRLVTGHGNGTIRVWDAQTYTPQATAFAHSEAVTCMAVCGTSLISASNDGLVKIWDLGAVDLSCDSCELKWIKVIRLPCEVVSLVTASPNSVFCSTKDRSIRRLSWSNLVRDVAG